MKLIKSLEESWLDKEGYSKKVLFENDKNKLVVQDIKIKPGETAKNHYHKKQNEVFYFLNENGKWIINGEELKPQKGDVLVIEPFDKHEVINDTLGEYLYIAFKFNVQENDFFWA